MANVWILFKNNLYISVAKKKVNFILTLVAPILILLLMGKILSFGGGNSLNIGIVDNDNTKTTEALVEFLQDTNFINVINMDENDINNKLAERAIFGVISFKEGYEEALFTGNEDKILITTTENDVDIKDIISDMLYPEVVNVRNLANVCESKQEYIEVLDSYKNDGEVKIERKPLSDLREDYLKSSIFVGFIIFFMLLRGSSGSLHYYEEKDENVFNRLFMAPVESYQYYLADLLSNYLVVFIQAIIGILGMKILGTNIGVSSGMLLLIMGVVGLVSVSLAICIRAFCNTYSEFNMIFNFLNIILIIVGGCFVPLDIMPKLVNNISYLTPTRWAIEAISDLQLGLGFKDIVPHIFIIILFAVVFFVIGSYKTTKSEKEFSII